MPIPFPFDFKNPDYPSVFRWRLNNLKKIRENPESISGLRAYYRNNIAQFITDWGVTMDPRDIEQGLPTIRPFLLFPRQEEWVEWFMQSWKSKTPGITDKSREMGMSWLMVSVATSICVLNEGVSGGFGSRKEEYVDKKGDPKSLLFKARYFLSHLPVEFRAGFNESRHAPHMRIMLPDTGSIITGEAGDGIGRGDRTSFYFVDESAWLPRPELVEASLSQTTNCRIDVSTPRGMNNPFARKRFAGRVPVFSFHWRDDPRKDQKWYEKICYEIDDPVIIAQEVDLDYSASMEGIVIPSLWVQAAIDAHIKLEIVPKGVRKVGLDIADEGSDKNAFCGRYGILVEYLQSWSGKGADIYDSVERACTLCDVLDYPAIDYDADGLGAGVRGDARVINKDRLSKKKKTIAFTAFRGSGAVVNPAGDPTVGSKESKGVGKGRTNEDFFANFKAQAWWALRRRFLLTYRAVVEKKIVNLDDIISIPSTLTDYRKLMVELSQPTYTENGVGKIVIDKMPEGTRSPNLADSLMIAFAPTKEFRGFLQ